MIRKKPGNVFYITILLLAQLLILLYFGSLKQGMHFDEFFSYFNTNNSAGRQAYDRSWVKSEEIFQDFYVKPDERFNYGYVVQLQGYDVHPPVYYILLHTVCSFSAGIYSKWQGLSLNIFCALITTVLFYLILLHFTKSPLPAFAVTALTVLNPGVISNVMFIRMYCLLTLWIVLCTYLHIGMEERIRAQKSFAAVTPRDYVLNGVLAFLGFLTHYFYLVYLFFTEIAFLVPYFIRCIRSGDPGEKKQIRGMILYGLCLASGGILAVLCFPQCLGHINSGYRGKEVKSYLFNLSDLGLRFRFFGGLLNRYVFGGALLIVVLWTGLLTGYCLMRLKKEGRPLPDGAMTFLKYLIVPVTGYFLVSVKGSLMGDEAMMRYQLPVYGLIILSFGLLIYGCIRILMGNLSRPFRHSRGLIAVNLLLFALMVFLPMPGMFGEGHHSVFYLYPEQKEMKACAAAHGDEVCVYIYNNEENKYLLWNDSEQLWAYDAVYFASSENPDPIEDEKIKNADKLVVYVSKMNEPDDPDYFEDMILTAAPRVHHMRKLYDAMYATVYEFYP